MPKQVRIFRRHKPETELPPDSAIADEDDKSASAIDEQDIEGEFNRSDLKALKRLARDYEKSLEYYYTRNRPWRTIWSGFVNGMARGLGIAVGITVLAFILLTILRQLDVMNLPILGNFIADLLEYIENVRKGGIY